MENTYYDYLQSLYRDDPDKCGCQACPFVKQCDQGGGYTQMDEHGTCPIENIDYPDQFYNAKFPN